MKTLMYYELAADGMAKAPLHMAGHQARMKEFHQRGVLLMAGPIGTPPAGALGVFTSREAAEEFSREDPFVTGGVVAGCRFEDWHEALA